MMKLKCWLAGWMAFLLAAGAVGGQEPERPLRPRVVVPQPGSPQPPQPAPPPPRQIMPPAPPVPEAPASAAPLPPRWWGEGEVAKVTALKDDETVTLGQGRAMAKGALVALRQVIPKLGDAVEADLVGKDKAVPGWAKPKAGSEQALALAAPLTLGQLKGLARPFYDRLHDSAPGWIGLRLDENGADLTDGWRYPWGGGEDGDGVPVKAGELKRIFKLDFVADYETGPAADGIPDLWEYGVVHADTTGKWRDIGQITLLNAAQIGAKSPAGPPPKVFALHAAGEIDRRIAGKKAAESLAMFLDYQANGKAGVFKRNPKFWAADLGQGLTALSPWNAMDGSRRAGVLITPRHVLVAHHFLLNPGTVITFVTAGNVPITRTVVTSAQVPSQGEGRPKTDFEVVLLDADLPGEITPCRLAPGDFDDYLPKSVLSGTVQAGPFIPALGLNQEEEGFVNQLFSVNRGWIGFALPAVATEPQRAEFKKQVIMYDSGNPDFFLVNGKLMLTTLWTGGGGGAGGAVWKNLPALNAAIADVDAAAKIRPTGYQARTVDLGAFLKY